MKLCWQNLRVFSTVKYSMLAVFKPLCFLAKFSGDMVFKKLAVLVLISLSSWLARADDIPLVEAARTQVGITLGYDGAYTKLTYPNGDVPRDRGVCTDVIIRALREAKNLDLQRLVHEDMSRAFAAYPKLWKLTAPDKNIDHRRVPNLKIYFQRNQEELPLTHNPADYKPGDIVTSLVSGNLPHIMLVSDKKSVQGVPLVIHNIGRGAQEEDALFEYPITGHYRLRP